MILICFEYTETVIRGCSVPAGIYLFKVNDGKTRGICEIRSKLKTTERSDVVLVSLLLTLNIFRTRLWCFLYYLEQVNAAWGNNNAPKNFAKFSEKVPAMESSDWLLLCLLAYEK